MFSPTSVFHVPWLPAWANKPGSSLVIFHSNSIVSFRLLGRAAKGEAQSGHSSCRPGGGRQNMQAAGNHLVGSKAICDLANCSPKELECLSKSPEGPNPAPCCAGAIANLMRGWRFQHMSSESWVRFLSGQQASLLYSLFLYCDYLNFVGI